MDTGLLVTRLLRAILVKESPFISLSSHNTWFFTSLELLLMITQCSFVHVGDAISLTDGAAEVTANPSQSEGMM